MADVRWDKSLCMAIVKHRHKGMKKFSNRFVCDLLLVRDLFDYF
jgi:hypothetical protein